MDEVSAVIARFKRKASDLAAQREYYDGMADDLPMPPGTTISATELGGIPAEQISAGNVRPDRIVLMFHGGGYVVGSPRAYRALNATLSAEAQATCVSIAYRLAPEHPFPAAVDDASNAYRALLNGGYGPSNIVFAGDSAGGGLVIAALVKARDMGLPMPAAGYAMSPWLDLAGSGDSFSELAQVDPIMTIEGALGCAGAYLQGASPHDPLCSPIYADLSGLPPLLLQVGSTEMFLDDSLRLARRAALARVHLELQVWPDMPHVWQRFAPVLRQAREAVASAGSFLRSRLDVVVPG